MKRIESDQPVITIVNPVPTEGGILNGKRSPDVYSGIKTPALGPAAIAGQLIGEGYTNVNNLDPRYNKRGSHFKTDNAEFTNENFELLKQSDVIGISSMTRTRRNSLELIKWIRENNPNAVIIAGGPDATFRPEKWLDKENGTDFVVRNEGEKTIIELMKAVKNGDSVENIKGISYKKDGNIINNERRPLMTEKEFSDAYPPFFSKDILKNSDVNIIESKRGCPNKCDFCSVTSLYEGTYRLKDSKTVIRDIKAGNRKKGTFFVDDNFAHKSRTKEVKQGMQDIIDAGLNDRDYFMQLDTVTVNTDPDFLKLAVKMGLFSAFLGIESVDKEVLKGMHKAATADQNIMAVRKFTDADIFILGMEILGGKGETRKSIDALRKWNNKSGINGVQIFAETPIVGSKLGDSSLVLPICENDTNLLDGQHVSKLPPDGFTCNGLQQEVFDAYSDFYSLLHIASALRPLRHILKNPVRSLKLTGMNIAVRIYARNLLSETINSEYTKSFMENLKQVDQEIYNEGKTVFNAKNFKQ